MRLKGNEDAHKLNIVKRGGEKEMKKKELNDSIAKRILKKIIKEGYQPSGDKSIVLEIIRVEKKKYSWSSSSEVLKKKIN